MLKIEISGCVGDGKTTVAGFLARVLAEAGVKVSLVDDEDHDWERDLSVLKGREVEIKTVQLNRQLNGIH